MTTSTQHESKSRDDFSLAAAGPSQCASTRAAALIITLSLLVTVMALVVTLFLTVTSERVESSAAANQSDAQHLASSVVNLVKSTITQATSGYEANADGTLNTSSPTAWASQPGLIRTWKQDGTPDRSFRLYSSGTITISGTLDLSDTSSTSEVGVITHWKTGATASANAYNALWCDLNAPALTGTGQQLVYPIVTPPKDKNSGSVATDPTNGVPTDDYITTGTQEGVQGFSITAAPGYTAGTASATNNPAPMPVKWLYILKNGSFVTPSGSGSTATVNGATKDNPIVGRVAYWTDDETCKVNINTASEGVYWDVPRGGGKQETALAVNAPVYNEWARVPGHPATTSLSAVFEQFSARTASDLQKIYSFTPRTGWGGSEMGTQPMGLPVVFNPPGFNPEAGANSPNIPGTPAVIPALPSSITLPTDRLFTSADELYFKSTPRDLNPAGMTAAQVQARGFFLTANSRASDTNLFEQPRISLWPITWINAGVWGASRTGSSAPPMPSADPSDQAITCTTTGTVPQSMLPPERLIAFATTVGRPSGGIPYRYFFTRQKALDSSYDFDSIRRNRELFDYLRNATSRSIPGFGKNFVDKWGIGERTQILASVFDYIRGTVNLNTAIYKANTPPYNLDPCSYFYTPLMSRQTSIGSAMGSAGSTFLGAGQVLPIRISRDGISASGAGRTPVITEAALVFYAIDRQDPVTGSTAAKDTSGNTIGQKYTIDVTKLISSAASQTTTLGCFLVLEMSNPVVGAPWNVLNSFGVRVTGSPFQVNGNSMDFPKTAGQVNLVNGSIGESQRRDSDFSPFMGIHSPFVGSSSGVNGVRTASQTFSASTYPFYGSVAVSPNTTTFAFSGGTVTVEILAPNPTNCGGGDPSNSPVSKTITLDFSKLNGTYPMPRAPRFNAAYLVSGNTGSLSVTDTSFGVKNPPAYTPLASQSDESRYPRQQSNTGYFIPAPVPTDEIVVPRTSGTQSGYLYQYTSDDNYSAAPSTASSHRNLNFRLALIQNVSLSGVNNVSRCSSVYGPYDTVLSLALDGYGPTQGDVRLLATQANVPPGWYNSITPSLRSANYGTRDMTGGTPSSKPSGWIDNTAPSPTVWLHMLSPGSSGGSDMGSYGATPSGRSCGQEFMPNGFTLNVAYAPDRIVSGRVQSLNGNSLPGMMDWTGSEGNRADGAVIEKPSEVFSPITKDFNSNGFDVPYFGSWNMYSEAARFSPNRQMASAVQLGTLPSGTYRTKPWQTLLFSPNPQAGASHPGLSTPNPFSITGTPPARPLSQIPDHLLLDLFTMPVAEPYPISEPLSTAGKVNMNYQVAPFTYIQRKTGLYAVLKALKMPIFVRSQAPNYKSMQYMADGGPIISQYNYHQKYDWDSYAVGSYPATSKEPTYNSARMAGNQRTRYSINIDETLKDFDALFSAGEIFRSASEVCDMFLVPRTDDADPAGTVAATGIPTTLPAIKTWWSTTDASSPIITADNLRESPYNQIYPRITTKSNTYTVHMRVQALKQVSTGRSANTDWQRWDESKDQVVSEYRGSSTIERYVDPNDPKIPDFAQPENYSKNLAPYYRWRTLSERQFIP